MPSGLETPDTIDLRKTSSSSSSSRRDGEEDNTPKQLFTVLEQTAAKVGSAAYLSIHTYKTTKTKTKTKTKHKTEEGSFEHRRYGSSHKYVIPSEGKEKGNKEAGGAVKSKDKVDLIKSQKTEKVDITLNPAEVEDMDTLSDDLLKKKWEQRMQEKAEAEKGEDMSDIVAEQARKKRKAAAGKPSGGGGGGGGGGSGADKSKKYKDFKF